MKPQRQKNVSKSDPTVSRPVTRSMTRVHRTSLPIPDELVLEIFSRLPLKSIARCRCVSKLWSSMLRSRDFTDSFLTKSRARPQLLFACEDHSVGKYIFFSSPQPENPGDNSRFDPVSNKHKVLSMKSTGGEQIFVHQVLTLGTDDNNLSSSSWRLVQCCVPHCSSRKWICIGGVVYYVALVNSSPFNSMLVCFDLRSEKFSCFVNFFENSSRARHASTALVNYDGRLGLVMSEDSSNVTQASKSFDLWVLQGFEWSKHVYVLPPTWKDVVTETMCIAGMVGTDEIVLSPRFQFVPSYVIYYNVESKKIRKVGIQGMDAFQGKRFYT
ncbi:putative F-box protein [Raphanus sativus]|uniref:F-box protein At3g23960 n=1 Tax=Raphanus sativus TaxID=3726 RepID=A0A6J0N2B1_RAPSA|nr:putative F-box protein At3g23960 [Raphanus sativus]KAJ4903408.1 putative F-box protein [Raphanus sativus]